MPRKRSSARRIQRAEREASAPHQMLPLTALQKLHAGHYAHVAQAYADNGSVGTAASLTAGLKRWARARVLAP